MTKKIIAILNATPCSLVKTTERTTSHKTGIYFQNVLPQTEKFP